MQEASSAAKEKLWTFQLTTKRNAKMNKIASKAMVATSCMAESWEGSQYRELSATSIVKILR
jgi:hypothetical protein